MQELAYARLLEKAAMAYDPAVVICSNTPIDIVSRLARLCRRRSVPWIYWLQDLYSVAIERYFGPKVPILGPLVSLHYAKKEGRLLRSAKFVVAISEGFLPMIEQLRGKRDNIVVIENWAPLDEIAPRARNNPWAVAQSLDAGFCFLYAGTLGLKHNPERLLELAQHFSSDANVRVVVVSEGKGADYLADAKRRFGLENLVLLPWQPFEELPNVLGTADVLLALLEPDAGVLSVPSKVLSNLAAGRPQLLAVPAENLAAETVTRAQAGLVAAPNDGATWLKHAERLRRDADFRQELAKNARDYARRAFDIDRIAKRFEVLMSRSLR
jgi:glycosyltransferase involved in cell wall biosynthesis